MEDGSTEFSFSRFLTPYLSGYEGQSLFMDCDVLVRCDIAEILEHVDDKRSVFAVRHDYTPNAGAKFLGNEQHVYPRKNWSSLMFFNNSLCKELTVDRVNTASGAYLHQFKWADYVGGLPKEFNHLVGEYSPNPDAKIAHFTLGTPCFKGYEDQEFADEWREERDRMLHSD